VVNGKIRVDSMFWKIQMNRIALRVYNMCVVKKKLALFLTCLPFLSTSGREHVSVARSQDAFYKRVQENPFAIVLFYHDEKHNRDVHEKNKQVLRAFRMASDSIYFRQARLKFVAVDIGKKGIDNLQHQYGVNQMPAFISFRYGVPVRNAHKRIVVMAGFPTKERIKIFINKYLRDDIETYLRLESEKREEERSYYGGSAYFGIGYAYDPYYPFYYGNYGYPYGGYSNYYAPGFGFGFSVPL